MDIPYIPTSLYQLYIFENLAYTTYTMGKRDDRHVVKRLAIDFAGFGLIIISPFLGWLPGPGGIPIFLAGLGILALNYDWAENLLKDFEKKRVEFVDRYLVKNKKLSLLIDMLSLVVLAAGILGLIYIDSFILRFVSLGAITLSIIILISNQRRIDRLVAKFRKPKT